MVAQHRLTLTWALLWALGSALLVAACGQNRPLRFPHEVHLAGADCGGEGKPPCLNCVSCHSPTEQGRAERVPEASLCASCHEKESNKMERVLHYPPERPYGQVLFDHERHLKMKEIRGQCVPCHSGVVEQGSSNLPPMSKCFTCHEHEEQWDQAECTPCHLQKDLAQTLPESFLPHTQMFLRNHSMDAVAQGALCESCHSQSDCQGCHDLSAVVSMEQQRPDAIEHNQVHRGNFMARHSIEARSQPDRCLSCHQPPDCDSCHIQQGVSGNLFAGRNPHPPGWVGGNPMSADFHGRAARRDLLSCAGCHEAGPATNCIRCHQVGGPGGNPHPTGWKSARSPSDTMCRYCHEGL